MSKAGTPRKVLLTALRRVQTRWGTGSWNNETNRRDKGGKKIYEVCWEGALFGGCRYPQTKVQARAYAMVMQVLWDEGLVKKAFTREELHSALNIARHTGTGFFKMLANNAVIPRLNDHELTKDDVERILKLTITRLETGGFDDPEDFYISDEELDNLLCGLKT